jgi:hypothetical protein
MSLLDKWMDTQETAQTFFAGAALAAGLAAGLATAFGAALGTGTVPDGRADPMRCMVGPRATAFPEGMIGSIEND